MKKAFFTIIFLYSLTITCQAQQVLWNYRFGGTEFDWAYHISQFSSGGFLLTGYSRSSISGDKTEIGKGSRDYWTVAIDSAGNKLWDKQYGGSASDIIYSISRLPGGNLVWTGSSESGLSGDKTEPSRGYNDMWIVKTDSMGQKIWDKRYGGSNWDGAMETFYMSDGGLLIVGNTGSDTSGDRSQPLWNTPVGLGYGPGDFWVVRVDSSISILWERVYGGNDQDNCRTALKATDGGFLLGGYTVSTVSGSVTQPPRSGLNYWIVKIDSLGNKLWDRRFGGKYGDIWCQGGSDLNKVIRVSSGGYLLGGYSESESGYDKSQDCRNDTRDYWIIRIDEQGNRIWDRTIGGNREDELRDILQTPDGGFLLGGQSKSGVGFEKSQPNWDPSLSTWDYWIVKTDSMGNRLWDQRIGGNDNDYFASMVLATDGNLVILGTTVSGVSGDRTQPLWGGSDYWVVKLSLPAPSGIGETPLLPAISVYPNPFSSTITVTAENIPGHTATLTLRNLLGEEILSQQTPVIERTLQKQLHVPLLPPGMYLLTLATESGNQVLKVIKGN